MTANPFINRLAAHRIFRSQLAGRARLVVDQPGALDPSHVLALSQPHLAHLVKLLAAECVARPGIHHQQHPFALQGIQRELTPVRLGDAHIADRCGWQQLPIVGESARAPEMKHGVRRDQRRSSDRSDQQQAKSSAPGPMLV
jgi:hypothetical protein